MYETCISKPLCTVLKNLNWYPDKICEDFIPSTSLHLYNPIVVDAIRNYCNNIMSQVVYNTNECIYWDYSHLLSQAFHGNFKMKLRENITPHLHQTEVINALHDKKNKKFKSATIQSPCASGKSLLSLLLISEMMEVTGSSALYVTISSTAVMQVMEEATKYFYIDRSEILVLDSSESLHGADLINRKYKLVIATYQLLTLSKRPEESVHDFNLLFSLITFGMVLMDETHYSCAENYSNIYRIMAPIKIGVSATVKRMDKRLEQLLECTGPKRLKIDRDLLVQRQLIPDVKLIEVHVDEPEHEKKLLSTRKLCIFYDTLLYHIKHNHSIIVFFETINELNTMYDTVKDLLKYDKLDGALLGTMKGETDYNDRLSLIKTFRDKVTNKQSVVLFMSSVGNAAYNFLCQVVIQIRCADGSGNVAAQRIGRVQRFIRSGICHLSYTFVSTKTSELTHATTRRAFLDLDTYNTTIKYSSNIPNSTHSIVIDKMNEYVNSIGKTPRNRQRSSKSGQLKAITKKQNRYPKLSKILAKR